MASSPSIGMKLIRYIGKPKSYVMMKSIIKA
jgi:hypothetical protein